MADIGAVARLPAGDPVAIEAAALAMQAGGIVGLPTETVYGLAVLPFPEALGALIKAKGRGEEKGIVLLIDDLEQVAGLVTLPGPARRLAQRAWPGPLTLVLPVAPGARVSSLVTGGRATLGLRLPDHPVPRAMARLLGPIAVTSANRAGEPAATSASELIERVGHAIALVIDDGPSRGGVPSTVVAVTTDGAVDILREGAVPGPEVRSMLPEVP